ncbi:uncharacterized protein DUF4252 [Lutibacter sp. Hel_I_33_5]|uniref:DUF4252 domain-containing protein n=1 Tax=Lutibacter sp. Hel_I_33_5 TaxID=1566289 RepID=UPI0011A1B85C|nr:DUF4252 domain-containing protein [Lutibacter sp. Hel_I_33_5]TVZ54928.1 uncharacterized protein DUF4252 [Lutibacter sp. Hel_I_33_5]
MKKITTILSILFVAVLLTSCKNDTSLQQYLVDSQDKTGFITVDVPTSFLQLRSNDVSDDVKETLKSIRKINLVALPIKGNEAAFETEKATLNKLFKGNSDYKSLMSMKSKGIKVNLYYTGDSDSIDEVIAYGHGKDAGVGVARLLGENMNPGKIIEMMKNIKVDADNVGLKQFSAIFKGK